MSKTEEQGNSLEWIFKDTAFLDLSQAQQKIVRKTSNAIRAEVSYKVTSGNASTVWGLSPEKIVQTAQIAAIRTLIEQFQRDGVPFNLLGFCTCGHADHRHGTTGWCDAPGCGCGKFVQKGIEGTEEPAARNTVEALHEDNERLRRELKTMQTSWQTMCQEVASVRTERDIANRRAEAHEKDYQAEVARRAQLSEENERLKLDLRSIGRELANVRTEFDRQCHLSAKFCEERDAAQAKLLDLQHVERERDDLKKTVDRLQQDFEHAKSALEHESAVEMSDDARGWVNGLIFEWDAYHNNQTSLYTLFQKLARFAKRFGGELRAERSGE